MSSRCIAETRLDRVWKTLPPPSIYVMTEGDEEARKRRKKRTQRESERERTEKVDEAEEGDLNPGTIERGGGGRGRLAEGEKRREEEVGRRGASGKGRECGPHLDAWDRHPRSLHQRTDSHRAHAALTYSRVLRRGDRLSW